MKYSYKDALAKVDSFSDRLGQSVDVEIKEVVAALIMHGYITSSSCEGHPDTIKRCYPFVVLNHPEPDDEWDEEKREAWLHHNIQQQKKLAKDLECFYQNHKAPSFNAKLVINSFGAGVAELRSFGAEFIELEDNVKQSHLNYLEELKAFAEYLKKKKWWS